MPDSFTDNTFAETLVPLSPLALWLLCFKIITCLISTDSDHGKQTALIGGVAGVCVFGLVAVIAMAVVCVKFRMSQTFTHGKEPVDLHADQNYQMGETNLGVSELDSI